MSKPNDFFLNMIGEAYRTQKEIEKQKNTYLPNGQRPKVDPALDDKILVLMLGIIAMVGVEPLKVIFRKNFGKKGIKVLTLLIACFAFFVIGIVILMMGIKNKNLPTGSLDGQISYIITGLFYIILCFFVLIKAILLIRDAKHINQDYKGDSHLLRFMASKWWSRERIQGIAEPFYTIAFGICFSLNVNILGGLPIVVCGLSLWGYMIMEKLFFGNRMENQIVSSNERLNKSDEFNNVQ